MDWIKYIDRLPDRWQDEGVKPDTSNIHDKREFTFLIEAFLKSSLVNCNGMCPQIYEELMEYWERW